MSRSSPGLHPDQAALEVGRQAAGAELDAVVGAGAVVERLAVDRPLEVDHQEVVLGRAAVDRAQLGDRQAEPLDLGVDRLGGHVGRLLHAVEALVRLHGGRRLHLDLCGEAERRALDRLVRPVDLGSRDGVDAGDGNGARVPAVQVVAERLLDHGLAAELAHDERLRAPSPCGSRGRGRSAERSLSAWSNAWSTSCAGTSMSRRTRFSASSETWVFMRGDGVPETRVPSSNLSREAAGAPPRRQDAGERTRTSTARATGS